LYEINRNDTETKTTGKECTQGRFRQGVHHSRQSGHERRSGHCRPSSVGYGASFEGLAALLTMLNSCASGVTVVNIDNGFSAGVTATLINKKIDAGK